MHTSLAQFQNQNMSISKLPDDVLTLIFEAGPRNDPVIDDYFDEESAGGKPLPFAVLVSHVSSTWRDVAIRDPFLWNTIGFIYSRPQDLFLMYVQRSKACGLDIHFVCDVAAPDFVPASLQLQRCRHLTITCHSHISAFHIFRCLKKETAPCLLSFKIDMDYVTDNYDHYSSSEHHELFQGGAPFLSSVEMCGISFRTCELPLGALTKLELSNQYDVAAELTEDEFYKVFTTIAPTLTHLRLDGSILRVVSEDNISVVDLPNLVSLDVRYPEYFDENECDGNYFSYIWGCINVPALESLTLYRMNDEQFHTAMASLQLRRVASATTDIRSLRLLKVEVGCYAEDLALACPSISDLTLGQEATNSTIKYILQFDQNLLASANKPESVFPNLRRLSVGSYDEETLRALVLGRKAAGCPLVTLHFTTCSAEAADWYRQHWVNWVDGTEIYALTPDEH